MTAAVVCRGVVKTFTTAGVTTPVLRGVDVSIPASGLTMLVGPSGCGKTTLLTIIAAMLTPDAGEVVVAGLDLVSAGETAKAGFRRRQIGFVFQHYNLLPALTAAENAAVPLVAAGCGLRNAARRAIDLLDRLGLAAHADKLPRDLSGGQQQRVAIARALIHEPALIVCDEPTAALDAERGRDVVNMLRETTLKPGRAVLIVTHDSRIIPFADRVVQMEDGRVVGVTDQCTPVPLSAA